MAQLSRALASEPLLAAHLLGPLCAVISGHRSTRLHHEIPALRKPSSSSSRKSPLTARYQPLVYSSIVGNPYLGIISGLPVIQEEQPVRASCAFFSQPAVDRPTLGWRQAQDKGIGPMVSAGIQPSAAPEDRTYAQRFRPLPTRGVAAPAFSE